MIITNIQSVTRPWENEENRYELEIRGYLCLIIRNRAGALCGYVGVPKGHPAYTKHYDELDISVHGGLTFSDEGMDESHEETLYYKPRFHNDKRLWWIGFDCAHYQDYCPATHATMYKSYFEIAKGEGVSDEEARAFARQQTQIFEQSEHEIYRDVAYVKRELMNMVNQLCLSESTS